MTRAAVYARKSTKQDVEDDSKSVVRQVENAKTFALAKGWTVTDGHVYTDDGVSGADTSRLEARARMIAAAERGEFSVIVMQAQDRFSRADGDEAFGELKRLASHVEVWFYSDGTRFESGTFAANTIGFLRGEFAAEYRRAIAQKTHETMVRKAKLGHVTGGKVFGYRNVPVNDHVERAIDDTEAAVVREIYQRYADGDGLKAIAHSLNARQLPSPRPQRGRPAGWDQGSVRAILQRSLYRGVVTYNQTKKRGTDGKRFKGRQPRKPEDQVIRVNAPQLRIVDTELADRVEARLDQRHHDYLRTNTGKLLGRPRGSSDGKHFLAGFIRCQCGATFEAVKGRYMCSARRRKGKYVCSTELTFDVINVDRLFLDALEDVVFSPSFIDRVLDHAFADDPARLHATLTAERDRLATITKNLTEAIKLGHDIPALVAELQKHDKELRAVDARLAQPVTRPDRDVLKAALELRSADWRDVLRGPHLAQARLILQHLVDLPIRVVRRLPEPKMIDTPGVLWGDPRDYKWTAAAKPDGLLVGLIHKMASPTGFEPVFWP